MLEHLYWACAGQILKVFIGVDLSNVFFFCFSLICPTVWEEFQDTDGDRLQLLMVDRWAGFHLENCPRGRGETGGIWIERGGGGGATWLKDVKIFTNAIWGVGVCLNVCVCVCRVSNSILIFGRGEFQSSVLTWKGCIAHSN